MNMESSDVKDAVPVPPGVLVTHEAHRIERGQSSSLSDRGGSQECWQGHARPGKTGCSDLLDSMDLSPTAICFLALNPTGTALTTPVKSMYVNVHIKGPHWSQKVCSLMR